MKKGLGRILGVLFMLLAMGMTACAVDVSDIKSNRVFQVNSDVELHEEPDAASAVTATLPGGTPVIVKEDAKEGWCMVTYREQQGYVEISFLAILGSQSSSVVTEHSAVSDNEAQSDNGIAQNNEVQPNNGATQNSEMQSNNGTTQNSEVHPDADGTQKKETQPDNITASSNEKTLDDEFKIIQEENQRAYQEAEAAMKQAKSDRVWGSVIAVLVIAIFAVGIVTTLVGNKGKKKER